MADINYRTTMVLVVLSLGAWTGCDRPLPRPEPVILTGPADRAVLTRPDITFSWQADYQAGAYRFQLALDDDFEEIVADDTIVEPEAGVDVVTDETYYWRVRAQSTEGVWSGWSEVWKLTLERFRVVATVPTQGYAQDIWVKDSRAYIADGQAGLVVFDLSEPEEPVLLGTVTDFQNEAWGVVATDSYAYVAYGYKELLIADVSNPDSLRIVGEMEYPQPGYGYDIDYQDSLVYIAADAQFIVVDVSEPQYPDLVFQHRYPRGCRGIALAEGCCYLALEQIGVAIWDVDSLPPVQLGSLDTPSNARGVAARGDYLYVADGRGGLVIADVADPQNPEAIATLELPGYAERISVKDTLVYVGCRDGGVAVVNVANPELPELVAQIRTSYTRGAQESGGYLFACDRDLGLVVIEKKE